MLTLDGAYGEGGGQILRTALLLSTLTDQPFRIENIRLGRTQPGLKPQHVHILKALLQMSNARVEGAQPGALQVTFYPGQLQAGVFQLAIGTAGAIPLFLQTMLPVACFAPGPVTFMVSGGTDVRGAMTMDFWQAVLLPFIQPYAYQMTLDVQRRGFYPAGGGQVLLQTTPRFNQADWSTRRAEGPRLDVLTRGVQQGITLFSCTSSALRDRRVAERQVDAFRTSLHQDGLQVQIEYADTHSPGSSLTAVAEYAHTRLGADALGDRRKAAEAVGLEAAERLQREIAAAATVDVHTADNLMVWAALFGGAYTFAERTGHIETNAWTIEQFLPGALRLDGHKVIGQGAHRI